MQNYKSLGTCRKVCPLFCRLSSNFYRTPIYFYIDESVVNAVIEYSEDKGYSPIQEKTDEGLFLFIPYKDNNPHEVVMGFCFDSEMIIPQGIKYKTKVYKLKRFYPHDEKTEDFFFDLVKNS
jgi:hypothetical protein